MRTLEITAELVKVVEFPVLVTSPVKLALVVTVAAVVADDALPVKAPEKAGAVTVPVKVGEAKLAFKLAAAVTKAVVATLVVLSSAVWVVAIVPVGNVGVPVKDGEAKLAFKLAAAVTKAVVATLVVLSSAVWVVAIVPVGNVGVPVNIGLARFDLRVSASCWAVETGLAVSAVLSTESKPTIVLVIPATVPVKVGEARGAFEPMLAVSVVDKDASFPSAVASSPRVSKVVPAVPTSAATSARTKAVVAT